MPRFSKYGRLGQNTVELRNNIAIREHKSTTNRNIRILEKIRDTQWLIEEVFTQNTLCQNYQEYPVIKTTMYFITIEEFYTC